MSTKTRINLQLPQPSVSWLREEAARLGITVPELMRRLIDKARGAL